MPFDVRTLLVYLKDDGTRPYTYTRTRTKEDQKKHAADYGGQREEVEMLVKDAREMNFTLHECSFQLFQQRTSLDTKDFYENQKVTSVYYDEMVNLLKETTGASFVYVFHHQIRDQLKSDDPNIQSYAGGIHGDSHPTDAEKKFKMLKSLVPKNCCQGRFMYLNVWRNISDTPIVNDHLAVCDETSLVKPDDYVTCDVHGKDDDGVQYLLDSRNSSQHKWYYFSHMKKDEVIVFKQWDSDRTCKARVCFHTSFKDPAAPSNAPFRQSIEVRALAYFQDHIPNTCPVLSDNEEVDEISLDGLLGDELVDAGVKKILKALDFLDYWKPDDLKWLHSEVQKKSGMENVAKLLVDDSDGVIGLKALSKSDKQKILRKLLNGTFEKNLRANLAESEAGTFEAFEKLNGQKQVTAGVKKILRSIEYLNHWPSSALNWLRKEMIRGRSGIGNIVKALVEDSNNVVGLKKVSNSQKSKIVGELLRNETFEKRLRSNLQCLPKK